MADYCVEESQYVFQSSDKGLIDNKQVMNKIEKLLPLMREEDMKKVLCQCYDRMLLSEKDIERRWGFNIWDEKRADGIWRYNTNG